MEKNAPDTPSLGLFRKSARNAAVGCAISEVPRRPLPCAGRGGPDYPGLGRHGALPASIDGPRPQPSKSLSLHPERRQESATGPGGQCNSQPFTMFRNGHNLFLENAFAHFFCNFPQKRWFLAKGFTNLLKTPPQTTRKVCWAPNWLFSSKVRFSVWAVG